MSGKRQNDIDMIATKGDIVKDIIADTISQEIRLESGIACNKRENTEIRVNIIRLENLVKQYDLNNPDKEVAMYDSDEKDYGLPGVRKLTCYDITRSDLEANRAQVAETKRRNDKIRAKRDEEKQRSTSKRKKK